MMRSDLVIGPQCALEAYRSEARTRCTTHNCTVASGQISVTEFRQTFQPVTGHDAHVLDAAVAQLGQAGHPVFGALSASADPHAEDVTLTGEVDPDRDVDGPVGDLAVSDLDVDGVDQHHRIHLVQWS